MTPPPPAEPEDADYSDPEESLPLDFYGQKFDPVQPQKRTFEGNFIKEFADWVVGDLPHIPRVWAEDCAISVLSTSLGGITRTATVEGPLALHAWFLAIGNSGKGKNQPTHEFVFPVIQRLSALISADMNRRAEEIEKKEQEKSEEKKEQEKSEETKKDGEKQKEPKKRKPEHFSLVLQADWTKEHMTKFLHYLEKKYGFALGISMIDEFTELFEKTDERTQKALSDFISRLYDGKFLSKGTIARGTEEVLKFYVNILATTTPAIFDEMDVKFFIRGTGNRFIITFLPSLEPKMKDAGWTTGSAAVLQQRAEKVTYFADWLYYLRQCPIRLVVSGNDQKVRDFKYEMDKRIYDAEQENPSNFKQLPLTRATVSLLKLEALHYMGNASLANFAQQNNVEAFKILGQCDIESGEVKYYTNTEDNAWAETRIRQFISDLDKLWMYYRGGTKQPVVKTYEDYTEQLVDAVKKASGEIPMLSITELHNKFHWDSVSYNEIIKSVFNSKVVSFVRIKKEGAGRPTSVMILTVNMPKTKPPNWVILEDWDMVRPIYVDGR